MKAQKIEMCQFQIPKFPKYELGTIQVLRHQRGGWVGWPNDDV